MKHMKLILLSLVISAALVSVAAAGNCGKRHKAAKSGCGSEAKVGCVTEKKACCSADASTCCGSVKAPADAEVSGEAAE